MRPPIQFIVPVITRIVVVIDSVTCSIEINAVVQNNGDQDRSVKNLSNHTFDIHYN